MNPFLMTNEAKINLLLLVLMYIWFLRFTTPSPTIQPLLHAVFIIGILIYILTEHWITRRFAPPFFFGVFHLLPIFIFGIIWSSGIVVITQFMSWLMSVQQGTEETLFYGSSGTQFLTYSDAKVCWKLLLPIVILTIPIHLIFRR